MENDKLKTYITSDVYEAAFFLMKTNGKCRPHILMDYAKGEALFSYKNLDRELPILYRKSIIPEFRKIFIELKREMFRIIDSKTQ